MVSRPPDDGDVAGRLALAGFQPFSAAQQAGVAYNLSPVLLLEVVERTNPACVQQSRLRPFNAINPGRTTPEADVITLASATAPL